jgi:hypothetical protein
MPGSVSKPGGRERRRAERPEQRRGDNLYPVSFSQRFGDLEMHLDVPAGVWNPTPHGVHLGDWTAVTGASHHGRAPWDCLVTNPPFAKSGKRYRRYFIDTLILDAHKLVRPGGELIFVQSSMADVPRSIRLMEECGMHVRIVGETDGPFRDYYFEDPAYLKEMASVRGSYDVRDGIHYERLVVFRARLPKDATPG